VWGGLASGSAGSAARSRSRLAAAIRKALALDPGKDEATSTSRMALSGVTRHHRIEPYGI